MNLKSTQQKYIQGEEHPLSKPKRLDNMLISSNKKVNISKHKLITQTNTNSLKKFNN
jgi:hypothetical protein